MARVRSIVHLLSSPPSRPPTPSLSSSYPSTTSFFLSSSFLSFSFSLFFRHILLRLFLPLFLGRPILNYIRPFLFFLIRIHCIPPRLRRSFPRYSFPLFLPPLLLLLLFSQQSQINPFTGGTPVGVVHAI